MINWIKRAIRWPWFGPKPAPLPVPPEYAAHMAAVRDFYGEPNKMVRVADDGIATITSCRPLYLWEVKHPQNPEAIARAAREATIAQKNVRLASIARERNRLKEAIYKAVDQKKKRSHLVAELARLTRMELELEGGK